MLQVLTPTGSCGRWQVRRALKPAAGPLVASGFEVMSMRHRKPAVIAALWLAVGVGSASAAALVKTITVSAGSSHGTHVCVASGLGVTEIDVSTGKIVKTIKLGEGGIAGVSSDGTHVWALNDQLPARGRVDEIKISKP